MVLVVGSQGAAGERSVFDGNEMLERCLAYIDDDGSITEGNTSADYVAGIVDIHFTFENRGDILTQWCIPDGVALTQLAELAVKYMQERSSELHHTASSRVANALILAFPCE